MGAKKIYQHILWATDLATNDLPIREKAAALAEEFGAMLSLVHVVEYMPSVLDFYGYFADTDLSAKMLDTANKMMFELGKTLAVPPQQLHIKMGTPKIEIVRLAEELGVDLIIVGSHTHHGLEKIIGYTASSVLQLAKCDVLTVRYDPKFNG